MQIYKALLQATGSIIHAKARFHVDLRQPREVQLVQWNLEDLVHPNDNKQSSTNYLINKSSHLNQENKPYM